MYNSCRIFPSYKLYQVQYTTTTLLARLRHGEAQKQDQSNPQFNCQVTPATLENMTCLRGEQRSYWWQHWSSMFSPQQTDRLVLHPVSHSTASSRCCCCFCCCCGCPAPPVAAHQCRHETPLASQPWRADEVLLSRRRRVVDRRSALEISRLANPINRPPRNGMLLKLLWLKLLRSNSIDTKITKLYHFRRTPGVTGMFRQLLLG